MRTVPAVRLPVHDHLSRQNFADRPPEYRALLKTRFEKANARLLVLEQELTALSKKSTPVQGNDGVQKSASLLFDLFNFLTVARAAHEVQLNTISTYDDVNGYVPGLTSKDTVRLLQDQPYRPKH